VFAGKQTMAYQVDCSVPQGSVLGPLGFVAYTDDMIDAIEEHDVSPDLYADDTQLRASSKPENVPGIKRQLEVASLMFHAGARHDGYSSTVTKLKESGLDPRQS